MFPKTILYATLFLINAHIPSNCYERNTESLIKKMPECMHSQQFRSSLRYLPLITVNGLLIHGIAKGSLLMPLPVACAQVAAYTLIMLYQDEIKSTLHGYNQKIATRLLNVIEECNYAMNACNEQAATCYLDAYTATKPKIEEALYAAQRYLEKKGTPNNEPINILGL